MKNEPTALRNQKKYRQILEESKFGRKDQNVSLSSLLASILYLSPLRCNMEWQRL